MNVKPAPSVKLGVQLKMMVPLPSFFAAFSSAQSASAPPANFTVHKSLNPSASSLCGIKSWCQSCGPSSHRPFPPESGVTKFFAQSGFLSASQLGNPGHRPDSATQFGYPMSSRVLASWSPQSKRPPLSLAVSKDFPNADCHTSWEIVTSPRRIDS